MVFLLLPLCVLCIAATFRCSTSTGDIYPALRDDDATDPITSGRGSDSRKSLIVGLIQSYDPAAPDKQLGAIGTVVGTEVALNHINADATLLPGYRLHYNFVNSQCNGYQATAAIFKQVLNEPIKIGIIGAGCSPSTQNAALVSQFYNLTQISCIATSPTLAQRDVYRRYVQLLPPEFETAKGFYSIISYYGWQKVGVILQEADLFEKTFIVLRDMLTVDKVDVRSYKLHFYDLEYYKDDVFAFDNFDGIRIFIIISYENFAIPMLCEAYKRKLWYPRYHFLLMGWYSHEWWKNRESSCTAEQMEQTLQHSLSVDILPDAHVLGDTWEAKDLDITNGEFYQAEQVHIADAPPPLHLNSTNYLSQYCYDATWAFAFALNKTIADLEDDTLNDMAKAASVSMRNSSERFRIEHFDYGNSVIAERMMVNWNTVSFLGVTGNVTFKNGLRELLRIRVTQLLEDKHGEFAEIHVGHLTKYNNFSISSVVGSIVWKSGEPHDGSVDEVVDALHIGVTATFILLGSLGILFAVACLLLNFILREKLIIKLSSPKLNYLIGAGAILLYINIILVVIPLEKGKIRLASILCCTTPWFTAIGYSLCYGTILVKMFRTWYIFNNPFANKKQIRNRPQPLFQLKCSLQYLESLKIRSYDNENGVLPNGNCCGGLGSCLLKVKDWILIFIVTCFVIIDVGIMAIYTGLEVSQGGASQVINQELEKTLVGSQEVVTHHYVYVCNSPERQVILGVLYGYKAVLQILALLLSFATWKVQIRGLDDSKPIIVATYVTSLVLAVVIVSTYTLTEYINAYATVFGVGFFFGTTLILCLVFMTKMIQLVKDPEGKRVFLSKSGDVREYRSSCSRMESQGEPGNSLRRITSESEPSVQSNSKEV